MPFADIRHQEDAVGRLQRGLAADKIGHAYIFEGPEGVGREMLATALSGVLLCSSPVKVSTPGRGKVQDACGKCEDCTLVAAGSHPDFVRIHRTLNRFHPDPRIRRTKATVLGVDVIRHFLIDQIGRHPARGRARVFVVSEAERMNDAAQNALLKTLEEPPGSAHLILVTTSAGLLLPTTRSRCQTITLRPLPTAFVEEVLTRRHAAKPADARFLAELVQGRLGVAIRHLESGLHEQVADVLAIVRSSTNDPLAAGRALLDWSKDWAKAQESKDTAASPAGDDADAADADSDDEDDESTADLNVVRLAQSTVLSLVAVILRDVLRASVGAAPTAIADVVAIGSMAKQTDARCVSSAISAVAQALGQVERSVNTGLIFDGVGIGLARGLSAAVAA